MIYSIFFNLQPHCFMIYPKFYSAGILYFKMRKVCCCDQKNCFFKCLFFLQILVKFLEIYQEKYLNFYFFEFLYLLFRSFVHYLKLQRFIICLFKEGFLMLFPKDCYLKIIDRFAHLEGLELFFVPRNNCYPLRIILSIACLKFNQKF